MIPEVHKDRIIQNGIVFIRSITECYGAETGMELWSQIAEVLDPSVKGEIFFAMFVGNYNSSMHIAIPAAWINSNSYGHYKVSMIKELRLATGMGLKESKDLVEWLYLHPGVRKVIEIQGHEYSTIRQNLGKVGFEVI